MSNQSCFSLSWMVHEEDDNSLLREFLKKKNISKAALTDIKFKGGKITLNQIDVTVRERVKSGDQVTVTFPPEVTSSGLLAERLASTDLVYEDDYLLVVVKPATMSTIPSRRASTGQSSQCFSWVLSEKWIRSHYTYCDQTGS